jgi:hypothetical protein
MAEAGVRVIAPGIGLLIAIADDAEMPPPGAGLTAVMPSEPALTRSADVSATVTAVALITVVGRDAPFTSTPVPATKPVPAIVTVVAIDPAFNALGEREAIVGAGFATTRAMVPEAPPPGCGFTALSSRGAALTKSSAVRLAVSCVSLTYVVVRRLPLTASVIPETKFVPVTVIVPAVEPTRTLAGARVETVGTGLLTCTLLLVSAATTCVPSTTLSLRIVPFCS